MMLSPLVTILIALGAALTAFFLGWIARRRIGEAKVLGAEQLAEKIVREAEREAETQKKSALLEAKDEWFREKAKLDRETQAQKTELMQTERRLQEQEGNLNRRAEVLDKKDRDQKRLERELEVKSGQLEERDKELARVLLEQNARLQRISGMTAEEAKQQLITSLENEARSEAAKRLQEIREDLNRNAEREAREIITLAIQRCAADHSAESTVSVVHLPSDEMKGRIIGREGRNIRALELHTGVDLIVDDTPEAVLISAYDPYRREIARLALQKLIADGRIHPARIEEVVEKVKKDMEEHLKEEGDKACFEVGVHGLHPELVKLVGRMKYRTSYGQNCLQHSKEVAWLAGMMAAEIKADVKLAKRMGLLHDIGKALTHEQEGSHPELSLQVLTKYGESPQIINAALCGHENVEPETIEAVLTEAADGISAARPGARRDVLESYIKRLAKLEEIAMSYKGVEMCYAIQAGRELRIMTKAEQISDLDAHQLAKDISKRIEAEMQYPGHIKVVVIRETRAVEVAK